MKTNEAIIAEVAERGYITENDFDFVCLYDCGNKWHSSFIPVYRCGGMEYYVLGGKINVVG